MPRPHILAVLLHRTDPETGALVPDGLPAGADLLVEGESGWLTIWPQGREAHPDRFAHAYLLGADATRGLFYVVSDVVAFINATETRAIRSWRTLQDLRDDTSPLAVAVKSVIRDERPEGATERVALYRRMAGFDDDDGET